MSADQAKPTARAFLADCLARRHGHGFWFSFRHAQSARRRAAQSSAALAPEAGQPPQMELFP
ncbi:hypothetical protein [Stenotrophomonas pictorum]|uniref:hypothetical protein n=1 Tax=Stenotrophomonas pictorum TaxID=86184 RepID=UPI000AFB00EF|nr:hypothetical protein [Stenotrophomonas pictorum]